MEARSAQKNWILKAAEVAETNEHKNMNNTIANTISSVPLHFVSISVLPQVWNDNLAFPYIWWDFNIVQNSF